jgi:hypothetical protein
VRATADVRPDLGDGVSGRRWRFPDGHRAKRQPDRLRDGRRPPEGAAVPTEPTLSSLATLVRRGVLGDEPAPLSSRSSSSCRAATAPANLLRAVLREPGTGLRDRHCLRTRDIEFVELCVRGRVDRQRRPRVPRSAKAGAPEATSRAPGLERRQQRRHPTLGLLFCQSVPEDQLRPCPGALGRTRGEDLLPSARSR